MSGLFDLYPPQPQPSREERKRLAVLDRIVPVVKVTERVLQASPTLPWPQDDELVCRPLVAELMVFYAEDLPDSFAYLSQRRLRELELDADSVHELALRNLPDRVPPIRLHGEAPRHMICCGGNFEASLLLMDGLWDSLEEELPGAPMVALPARDLLFVTGSEWEGAHGFLMEMAAREPKDLRLALTRRILQRKAGRWVTVGGLQ